jgi:hypothetical protein
LWFCKNGTAITKLEFNSFEAFLLALAELPQLAADGASVDKVEIQLSRQRLKEQQCEELAAILACRIPLKKVLIMMLANKPRRKNVTLTCSCSWPSIAVIVLNAIRACGSPVLLKRLLATLH